jgi:hypothetical protein
LERLYSRFENKPSEVSLVSLNRWEGFAGGVGGTFLEIRFGLEGVDWDSFRCGCGSADMSADTEADRTLSGMSCRSTIGAAVGATFGFSSLLWIVR